MNYSDGYRGSRITGIFTEEEIRRWNQEDSDEKVLAEAAVELQRLGYVWAWRSSGAVLS